MIDIYTMIRYLWWWQHLYFVRALICSRSRPK